MTTCVWKMFRRDKQGKLRTLYCGWNGSRTLPVGGWLKAEKKMANEHGPNYLTGWHCFLSKEDAEKYRKRFKIPVELIQIKAKNLRPKWSGKALLADFIQLTKEK